MATNSFLKYLIVFGLAGLFALSLITFAYRFQQENNAQDNILNNQYLSRFNSSLMSNLSGYRGSIAQQENASLSESAKQPTGAIFLVSMFTALPRSIHSIYDFNNAFLALAGDFFGVPAIVIGIVFSMIILLGVYLAYRLIKIGE